MNASVKDAVLGIKPGMCSNEYCIQRYLARRLMARYHVVIDGIEVDVLGNGWAAEVKMGSHFYDGIGQALAYRRILGIEEVWLIHVVDGDPSQHLNKLPLLIAGLGIMAAIVHRGGVEFI